MLAVKQTWCRWSRCYQLNLAQFYWNIEGETMKFAWKWRRMSTHKVMSEAAIVRQVLCSCRQAWQTVCSFSIASSRQRQQRHIAQLISLCYNLLAEECFSTNHVSSGMPDDPDMCKMIPSYMSSNELLIELYKLGVTEQDWLEINYQNFWYKQCIGTCYSLLVEECQSTSYGSNDMPGYTVKYVDDIIIYEWRFIQYVTELKLIPVYY